MSKISLQNPGALSDGDLHRMRTYHREFFPALVAYGVLLGAGLLIGPTKTLGRVSLSVALVVSFGLGARAIVRSIRRSDEYQRSLQLGAMSVGFGIAMACSLAFGFAAVAGFSISGGTVGWVTWSTAMGTWAASSMVAQVRAGRA